MKMYKLSSLDKVAIEKAEMPDGWLPYEYELVRGGMNWKMR